MRARATRCTTRCGAKIGTVADVNLAARTIDIKKTPEDRGRAPDGGLLSQPGVFGSVAQVAHAAGRGGARERVLRSAIRGAPPSTCCSVARPRRGDASGRLQRPDETTVQAACRIALALDGNVLAIQGPPGTGKTYTGAHIICALVRAGLKVGVTAVSHKVIVNLLEGAAKQAREEGLSISIVHREEGVYPGQHGIERRYDYDDVRAGAGRRHDPGARRHRVVLGTPGFRAKRRRADRRRGRPDVARQRAGHGARRAQPGPARRPAAARAAAAEQPPRGQRGVGALSRARRRGHDARGQGTVPGRDVSAPSGHREVHVRGLLRGQGRIAPGTRATGDRFARRISSRRSRVPG